MTAGNISPHHVNAPGSKSLGAISEELGNLSQWAGFQGGTQETVWTDLK